MSRLWDKGQPIDEAILSFCVGDDPALDERLVAYDVRASAAHARMLARCGHLTGEECEALLDALGAIARDHAAGEWSISREEEDCHTALERRLVERLGSTGEKIHLGRSRNDQVLAALRLYLLDVVDELARDTERAAATLDTLAEHQGGVALPGYTHLRRAMPSSVALWAGGFAAEWRDDAQGLLGARRRLSLNPLGSAAGYGVPVIEISREWTTQAAGFLAPQEPVTAVQLSRGKAEAQVAFEIVLLLQDIGRFAADVVLFSTSEFGFVRLDTAITTGSSIMPQKRNPDVFELLRGHAAQSAADLDAILAVTSKMPSGYHRDTQLIKPPLFRAIDRARACLAIVPRAIEGIRFDSQATAAAMDPSMNATARAYELVRDEGLTFRAAYRRIGAQEIDGC